MAEGDAAELRSYGYDENQTLDIDHMTALFNYVNRVVLGLGSAIHPEPNDTKPDKQAAEKGEP